MRKLLLILSILFFATFVLCGNPNPVTEPAEEGFEDNPEINELIKQISSGSMSEEEMNKVFARIMELIEPHNPEKASEQSVKEEDESEEKDSSDIEQEL
jgi:hypothetical protein